MKAFILAFLAKHFPALNPFYKETLDQIVAGKLKAAELDKQQAEHTIKTHRFLKHMAQAQIAALIKWNQLMEKEDDTVRTQQ